jgi:acetylornithine deacetylase/succinyl-diaminopimelate desuccinylase-like protein
MGALDNDVVALLQDLVAIDSVNPSLVPAAAGERGLAAYVGRWASRAGLEVEVLEATSGRPSVVVVAVAAAAGRPSCCVGTWTPSGWAACPTRSYRASTVTGSTAAAPTT